MLRNHQAMPKTILKTILAQSRSVVVV